MNFRVCESPWVKVYWYELEDLSELSDEELLQTVRTAQKFYRLAIRANGDEEKLQTLVDGADTEQNVFLRAFCRSFGVAQEKTRIYRENARKRWEKAKKEKEGIPNAEPAPLVDESEGEERKPYGAKKNVMLSDSDVESIRNAYPEATDKDFRIAVDRVSLKWSGKFEKPASWTKSVSGAVEQILIARRDEKYYQQKEGFRKEREEMKAEKTKMIEGVRKSLNFEPQEKPTVPDEFEVPF